MVTDALQDALDALVACLADTPEPERVNVLNHVREALHAVSPVTSNPVDLVRWVPLDRVKANHYNPNAVAKNEMRLLYVSLKHDGFTQPVVTVREGDRYVIVDGFHRYFSLRSYTDLQESTGGLLPVVVLDKGMNDRMASTVRHNRARGKHSLTGMASMVFQMLDNGWKDEGICAELGMEAEELIRLKHVTGFSKLFENTEYRRAWETRRQIEERRKWEAEHEQ